MDAEGKLCAGIYGTGQVAVLHAAAFSSNPYTKVKGICGRSTAHATSFVDKHIPGVKVFSDYDQMLDDSEIDIISVCMPNYLHAEAALKALRAGKHLVLEKPAGITREELSLLAAEARRSPMKTVVSFTLRWDPLAENIKLMIDKGAIGNIYSCSADYWHGIKKTFSSYGWIRHKEFAGGAMITGGCHAADIARYFNGEIDEVFAYSFDGRNDFDYPTTLMAAVKFANGSIGRLSASLDGLAFPYQFNMDVLGTDGAIRGDKVYSKILFPKQKDWVLLPVEGPNTGSVEHHPFKDEIGEFVNGIVNGTPIRSTLEDAVKSMEVAIAITESAVSGKPERIREY